MKTTSPPLLAAALLLAAPAFAAEPGDPPKPPTERNFTETGRPHRPRVPAKPVPFLGVAALPAPAVLSSQLNLPEGFGLVVGAVAPDSPAASAGVQQNDVLKMFNDQQLIDPVQFERLVQAAGRDAEITLTVLRHGQEQKLRVKIGERVPPERGPLPPMEGMRRSLGGIPDDVKSPVEEMRRSMAEMQRSLETIPDDMKAQAQEMRRSMEEMRRPLRDSVRSIEQERRELLGEAPRAEERTRELPRPPEAQPPAPGERPGAPRPLGGTRMRRDPAPGEATARVSTSATIVMKDDHGEIEITAKDGHRTLVAKGEKGEEIFRGPIDTPEQIEALPEDLRKKVNSVKLRTDLRGDVPRRPGPGTPAE